MQFHHTNSERIFSERAHSENARTRGGNELLILHLLLLHCSSIFVRVYTLGENRPSKVAAQ